jgi:hypothetical protein
VFLRQVVAAYAVIGVAATAAFAGGVHKPLVTPRPLVVSTSPPPVSPISTPATSTPPVASPPVSPPPANDDAQSLTVSLLDANSHLAASGAADHSQRLAELLAIARIRHDALASLIESDPAEVLSAALTSSERADFPGQVASLLEQEAQEDGDLEVYHVDHKDPALSKYLYFLKTAHGKLALHFANEPPALLTGAKVRVHGIKIDNMLALDGGGTAVQQVAAAPVPNALGPQRTLVILVNFQDNPAQPYTVADAQSVVFGTTSNFFLENSYQQTWLNGDVVGWLTIATSSSVCDTSAIATQAQSAAAAAGVNVSAYTHQVYAFPQNACGWWGLSSVGGSPSQTWIDGDLQLAVVGHELGHALGLWHSHALDCGTVALGPTCTAIEYGDLFDKMGGTTYSGHFNSFQKERLGWLNSGSSPLITTVDTSGTHTLEAYETVGSAPKALKILKSTDPATGYRTWYYIEARKAIGFDGFLATVTNNAINGVLIRMGSEPGGDSSYLVDMTPAIDASIWDWFVDAPLVAGQSYSDAGAGSTITTNWVTATAASVTVSLTTPAPTASAVTVSTDKLNYTLSQSVSIKATVVSSGSPIASAKVSFTVKKSNGAIAAGTATTGTNGTAVYKFRLSRKDPIGTYEADANAVSHSASTKFTVQ